MELAFDRKAQRESALIRANEVRLGIARWRRDTHACGFRDGCERVVDLLLHGDMAGPLGALSVGNMLKSVKGAGAVRIRRWLRDASVQDRERQIRQLTTRQRLALVTSIQASLEAYQPTLPAA